MKQNVALATPEFDQYAGDYDRLLSQGLAVTGEDKEYFAHGRIGWVKNAMDLLQVPVRRIVDYGCGLGNATPELLSRFDAEHVLGIDSSRALVERAREEHGSGRILFHEVRSYRPQEEADLVYCSGVFHHIPPGRRESVAQHIWSCLKPGGYLAFWENNPVNPGTRYVMSRIPFDRDAITLSSGEATRLLQGAGFHIVSTDFLFIFPKPLAWLRWLEPHLSSVPLGAQYLVLARKVGSRSRHA